MIRVLLASLFCTSALAAGGYWKPLVGGSGGGSGSGGSGASNTCSASYLTGKPVGTRCSSGNFDMFYLGVVDGFHVATYFSDSGQQTFASATNTCFQTSSRLPSRNELEQIYLNRSSIGGFSTFFYWSSTEDGSGTTAWALSFGNGSWNNASKTANYYVRCVRSF
jgi:hypothetical protein